MNTAAPNTGSAARFIAAGAPPGRAPHASVVRERRMCGMRFCDVTLDEVVMLVDEQIAAGTPQCIVTPNVDHVCRYHRDDAFRAAYENAWLVLCDGMPIIWVSRLLGRPLRQKLSGSDLITWLSGHAADRGYSVYFFGAQEGVAAEAADQLKRRFPALKIAGVHSPAFGFYADPEANAAATTLVRDARPDIVFVALGSPKQEIWMHANACACGAPVMIGVGAAFDFLSGRVKRAPVWMQRASLEWVWRLYQEPRRLWRRYLVEDALFLKLLLAELWSVYVSRPKPDSATS
ncbi:MAG: WecB/TagA/CpsF family glycosyltransferase [Candidatus Hydrogenedentes bacterium]|nr:WecB/TagA/CpsF family glycosyltransferase [Candidatus Hydrogenedentota bacterium]